MLQIRYFLILLLILPVVYSEPSFYLQKQKTANINFQCTDDRGIYCDNSYSCNWTVTNPNKEIIINNGQFENQNNIINYTIDGQMLNIEGDYYASATCTNISNGLSKAFYFRVNTSGQADLKNNNIAVYLVLGIVTMLYAYFAFKVNKDISKAHLYLQLTFFIATFLNVIGLILYGYWDLANLTNKDTVFFYSMLSNFFVLLWAIYLIVVKIIVKIPSSFQENEEDEEQ